MPFFKKLMGFSIFTLVASALIVRLGFGGGGGLIFTSFVG
jgi:hypothetical protein